MVPETLWEFEYRNWRGELHTYLIQPELEMEFCEIGTSGRWAWVLHGIVIQRDGKPRSDGQPRRSFEFVIIKNLREVDVY